MWSLRFQFLFSLQRSKQHYAREIQRKSVLYFLIATFEKCEKQQMKLFLIFYITQCNQNIIVSAWTLLKGCFICLFHTKCSKSCILTSHLSSNATFLLEILDLYLDFMKFTLGKINSHIQVVSNLKFSNIWMEYSFLNLNLLKIKSKIQFLVALTTFQALNTHECR